MLRSLHRYFGRPDLLIHVTIDFLGLCLEVNAIRLPGVARCIFRSSRVGLHDRLGLTNVTRSGVLGALHEDVLLDHFGVRLVRQLLALGALFELHRDDT